MPGVPFIVLLGGENEGSKLSEAKDLPASTRSLPASLPYESTLPRSVAGDGGNNTDSL